MPTKHNNNVSLKGLRAVKDVLNELIAATAELTAGFDAVETMSRDTDVEIDGSMLEECRSMVTVMNRLMFRQLSELKHRQLMGIVTRKTEMEMDRIRRPLMTASR